MKKKLVFLTGAGVSKESGLQTFRDADGLWAGHNIYEVCHPMGWRKEPQTVLDFYNLRRREVLNALPNKGHIAISELESSFDVTVVTQNIDDLHERAGSQNVIHLHGDIFASHSERDKNLSVKTLQDIKVGDLAADGGQLRPSVVFFGEDVPLMAKAEELVAASDIFVVVGTSLAVYPAAGLISVAKRAEMWLVDPYPPKIGQSFEIRIIAEPATTGVPKLQNILINGSKASKS